MLFKNVQLHIWLLIYLLVLRRDRFSTVYIYYKIMKKLHMRTIIGSSGSGCVLSYFNFKALKLGFQKVIYFGWVSMTPHLPTFMLEE